MNENNEKNLAPKWIRLVASNEYFLARALLEQLHIKTHISQMS